MEDAVLNDYIVNIVQMNLIPDQNTLQKILNDRGIHVPQATLSRKLKKLHITKESGIYKVTEYVQQRVPAVLNMQVSEFGLIVMHTHPGQAGGLAYFVDRKYVNSSQNKGKIAGILGTIAGDDVVVIIVKNQECLDNALEALYETFPYLR
jgi:transcriptional regulator of arginine metabolism